MRVLAWQHLSSCLSSIQLPGEGWMVSIHQCARDEPGFGFGSDQMLQISAEFITSLFLLGRNKNLQETKVSDILKMKYFSSQL